jgi:copper chaperone CopZ
MRPPLLSLLPILLLTATPLAAQLRSAGLTFEGIDCASCLESLPARILRMRGVESAKVDVTKGILTVKLAAGNRVRLEQLRDAIEQDGTKARQAAVIVKGTLAEEGPRWLCKLPNGAQFEISLDDAPPSAQYSLKPGPAIVTGTVKILRPESGPMAISPSSIEPVEE